MQTSVVACMCNSSGRIVTDLESGEMICSGCVRVSSDRMVDTHAEWRIFDSNNNNNRQRVGSPNILSLCDRGLFTVIGSYNKDAAGHILDASVKSAMQRLRIWDARSQVSISIHRNLMLASSAKISKKTKRIAINAMEGIIEKELSAEKNPVSLAATVLYMSRLSKNKNSTRKSIAEAAGVIEATIQNSPKDWKDNSYMNQMEELC